MERFRILSAVLAIAAITAVCAPLEAQTSQDVSTPQAGPAMKAAPRAIPFSFGGETPGAAASVQFRPSDGMTQQDRDLAAGAESAIGERARDAGLEFSQGKWDYRQIVCSALPNHLFLQYTRDNGAGDVSVFSASIPRNGGGRVRIIPVLRRGYSPFSPAPVNELTIAVFNHIRAEENAGKAPGWLATGLCYAALAGGHPQVAPPDVTEIGKLPAAPPAILEIPAEGGAVISFTDASAARRPLFWSLSFDGSGKLLRVTQSPESESSARVVELTPAEVHGKTVLEPPAASAVTQPERPLPKGKAIKPTPVEGKPVPQGPVDLSVKPASQ